MMIRWLAICLIALLCLGSTHTSVISDSPPPPGVEVYANGGNYWHQTGSTWGYRASSGFCYLTRTCMPRYMQYGYNDDVSSTVTARWDNIDYPAHYGTVYIFVPSTHATATAEYTIRYEIGSITKCRINQNNYYNQWVPCGANRLGINDILLTNYSPWGTPKTHRVAFDEIKIEY